MAGLITVGEESSLGANEAPAEETPIADGISAEGTPVVDEAPAAEGLIHNDEWAENVGEAGVTETMSEVSEDDNPENQD